MKPRQILAVFMDEIGLDTIDEAEHFATCPDCSMYLPYESGPDFCNEFRARFRGWTPPPPTDPMLPMAIWGRAIFAALQTDLIYGRHPDGQKH